MPRVGNSEKVSSPVVMRDCAAPIDAPAAPANGPYQLTAAVRGL
jgi:hypothetical protein